jgi:hypothetical protein
MRTAKWIVVVLCVMAVSVVALTAVRVYAGAGGPTPPPNCTATCADCLRCCHDREPNTEAEISCVENKCYGSSLCGVPTPPACDGPSGTCGSCTGSTEAERCHNYLGCCKHTPDVYGCLAADPYCFNVPPACNPAFSTCGACAGSTAQDRCNNCIGCCFTGTAPEACIEATCLVAGVCY